VSDDKPPAAFIPVYPGLIRGLIRIAGAIAMLVLIGWCLHIETLKRVIPGVTSMNPLTAIAIVFTCGALWGLKDGPAQGRRRGAGLLCATIVLLIGATRLSDVWAGTHLCPDDLLFSDELSVGQNFPSRIAPNAALCFCLLGLALLVTDLPRWPRPLHPQLLMLPLVCLVWAAVVGYAYNSSGFYQVRQFIPMAPHTALCLLMLAVALVLLRPGEGMMRHLPRGTIGARSMRRLLPACVLVPLVLGGIQLAAAGAGKLDPEQGASLASVATTMLMTVLAYLTALSLNHTDTRRQCADAELQERQRKEQRALEWTQSLSELEDALRSSRDDLPAGAAALLATLVRKCGALQGSLYQALPDAGGATRLRVLALYAYDRPEQCEASFAMGEGLVGQCAASRRPLRIDAVPSGYFRLRSATMEIMPRHLLFLPIMLDDEALGVLELASFGAPTDEVEHFLRSALRILAFGIYRYGREQQLKAELARLSGRAQPLTA
jgi:hypothetical protein